MSLFCTNRVFYNRLKLAHRVELFMRLLINIFLSNVLFSHVMEFALLPSEKY